MNDSIKRRSWTRRILIWVVRALYISVILAMCDLCSLSFGHHPIFSIMPSQSLKNPNWKHVVISDEFVPYNGFCYTIVNYTVTLDRARTLGPVIVFWFMPFITIDFSHGTIQTRRTEMMQCAI
jgi:hypothetical protein